MEKIKAIIMGAAGRDFHNYNVYFKNNPYYKVVAFTAAQIPDISGRKYCGVPIYAEEQLGELIKKLGVKEVFFAYSDVSYKTLMEKAAYVMSCGAGFNLLGKDQTMIRSKKPVIAVTAVRTGCGKSGVSQMITDYFAGRKLKVGIVRHPMPYGDLTKQICQRFETLKDLDKHKCTIEEREEYEPYVEKGFTIYAGVDYEKILREAEKESDIILWDGGNNDFPFYKSDLFITLADAYRPNHEVSYYPGEVNFRSADVIVINKVSPDLKANVDIILENARRVNPKAKISYGHFALSIDNPALLKKKKVLIVEDGPSVTHGGLPFGAGFAITQKYHPSKIVDCRPYVVGSIKRTFESYPHLQKVLPAMGYSPKQMKELETVINRTPCDSVILATPSRIEKFLKINKPYARVNYAFEEVGKPILPKVLNDFLRLNFKR